VPFTAVDWQAEDMPSRSAARQLATADTIGRVDGIATRVDADRYRFDSALGSVVWRRVPDGADWIHEIESVEGTDLLDLHDATRFIGLDTERSAYTDRPLHPADHGRPYAYDSLSQLFDDPKVPSTLLVPASGFPLHANTGNHGAITSVQCRGLFLAAGPGIAARGWTDAHARIVDIAPTILAALGAPLVDSSGPTGAIRSDARLRAQDGDEITDVLDATSGPARHAVAVVFDGCNTNLLAELAAAGELPHVASLLARGAALRHGTVASFPTVTLPNHTSAFTGVHPGRHGIVNNEFRQTDGTHVNLLDFASMVRSCDWLSPDVETLHEAVLRWRPDAFTAATYEYADRGATWSTFAEFRARRRPFYATPDMVAASSTAWALEASDGYRFQSRIDESSLGSAIEQWRGPAVTGHPLPSLQLVNLSLTDSAGHESGPHEPLCRASVVDSDRRLGRLLAAIEAAGALDHTAVFVVSDHGMEQCDPALLHEHRHADIGPLLSSAGVHDVGDVLLHPIG
jgi:hypothetical protein